MNLLITTKHTYAPMAEGIPCAMCSSNIICTEFVVEEDIAVQIVLLCGIIVCEYCGEELLSGCRHIGS